MGPALSQTSSSTSLHELFPKLSQYKLQPAQSQGGYSDMLPTYTHQQSNRIAQIRSFQLHSAKPSIQSYYTARRNIKKCPYIFQLIDIKVTPSVLNNKNNGKHSLSERIDSNLCKGNGGLRYNKQEVEDRKTMWMLAQSSSIWLEDEIINRVDKKCFQEIQLWSVLSNCVLGATALLENGFKQPVLSPKGIGLSRDGSIQVGEWELISKINYDHFKQEGEVLFGKLGQPISESNKNSLNEILLNYYWAPQGLRAMQNFISLGSKEAINSQRNSSSRSNTNKFQIFSLGMTLISMCLRNFYYRTDTFSEKYLQKLTHQAVQIRKIEGKDLSHQMKSIIESMVKWDPSERVSYSQLKDRIVSYFSQHAEQMKNSEVSLKTFNQSDNLKSFKTASIRSRSQSQTDNLSMNLTSIHNSFTDGQSMNFGQGQIQQFQGKQRKVTKSVNQCSHHIISTTSSAFDGYQGSGLVEQGTGDQDDNLRDQGEQIDYENKHQRALKSVERKSTSSPNNIASPCTQNKQQLKPCPPCTPISTRSPEIIHNSGKRKMQNSPYLNNEQVVKISSKDSAKDQRTDSFSKSNQIYLKQPEESKTLHVIDKQSVNIRSSNTMSLQIKTALLNSDSYRIEPMLNSASNRGSYRSSNKQPPLIRSARPTLLQNQRYLNCSQILDPMRTYHYLPPIQRYNDKQQKQELYPFPSFKLVNNNAGGWSKSISFKQDINLCEYRGEHTQCIEQDHEDQPNILCQYNRFRASELDELPKPDIFEKQGDQPSSILSIGQSRHSLQQSLNINDSTSGIINNEQHLAKPVLSKQEQIQNLYSESNYKQYDNQVRYEDAKDRKKRYSQNEQQFMTFNQKDRNQAFEDSFHQIQLQFKPSKWNKTKLNKKQNPPIQKQQESLFTDPKLLQYIRSPIKSSLSMAHSLPYFPSKGSSSSSGTNQASNINLQSSLSNQSATPPLSESTQYRVNQQNIMRCKEQSKENRIVLANGNTQEFSVDKAGSNRYTTQGSGIVREKVAKGFYEGEKKNGMRSGYGVFYYNEGGKYKGNWLNNMMHGKGTLEYADGRIAYQGEWHCDELHGKGVLYNQSPNLASAELNYQDLDELDECWVFYQGTFNHDDKDGMGLLVLSNQEQFIGEFKHDLAEGVGEYLKNDGSVIKGIWSKNKLIKVIEQP